MSSPLGDMDPVRFLETTWQRKPLLLRQALPDFEAPLDGDDLAGLACEPIAEARLVEGPDAENRWTLRHGPFSEEDFGKLGDRNWTLLVQDVEKHFPPLHGLLARFDFLPSWRRDDLMMSFAAPGGSVGPHVDQYDVFLLQGEGRRRWQIASTFDPARREDAPLDMLSRFEAEEEWVLDPGDMLYLPPGIAHHGVAETPCVTWSIGFRAPSGADLALGLGEWLADQPGEGGRYRDPPLAPAPLAGHLDGAALASFRRLIARSLDDEETLPAFLAAFLSRFRQAQEPHQGPDRDSGDPVAHLARDGALTVHPWARMVWVDSDGPGALLYASGRPYRCSRALAAWLCSGADGQPPSLGTADAACLRALCADAQLLLVDS